SLQYSMMFDLGRLVRRSARWLLRNYRGRLDIAQGIATFKEHLQQLWQSLPALLPDLELEKIAELRETYLSANVPKELVDKIVMIKPLYSALDIIEIALSNKLSVKDVAA